MLGDSSFNGSPWDWRGLLFPAQLPSWPIQLPDITEADWITAGIVYGVLLSAGLVVDVVVGIRLISGPRLWDERAKALLHRPWVWKQAVVLIAILLVLQFLSMGCAGLCQWLGWLSGRWEAPGRVLIQGVVFHCFGFAAITGMMIRRRLSWNETFGIRLRDGFRRLGEGGLYYLAVIPVLFASWIIYQLVLTLMGVPITVQDVAVVFTELDSVWMRIGLFLVAFCVAPVFEELVFRGIGLPVLARWLGIGPAVVLTSALFAGIHFHLPSFLPLFVLATGFSLAYIYTESLVVPIVMHAVFNGVNVMMIMTLFRG